MSTVHVAVGVVINSEGAICIALRPEGKHLAGYWEFPGGKVEQGESVFKALQRELKEELAIDIHAAERLTEINFNYPEKTVCLDVHTVREFSGEAKGQEQQEVLWVRPEDLKNYRFPEANQAIIQAILQAE